MMKRLMMLLFVLMLAVPMARADDAAKAAKAQELFQVMHMEKTMNQLMGSVMGQVSQMTKTLPGADQVTPAQQKMIDQYMAKVTAMIQDSIGWKALEPDYVKLYATTYSEEELDAILIFYKSDAGQKMLDKTPELTQGGIKIVQARMVEFQPKMKSMQDEFFKQMMTTVPKKTTAK